MCAMIEKFLKRVSQSIPCCIKVFLTGLIEEGSPSYSKVSCHRSRVVPDMCRRTGAGNLRPMVGLQNATEKGRGASKEA